MTFVARDLEPVRGFNMLMQALPELLRRRPNAQVVICGGSNVSYGRPPPGGRTWRDTMMEQFPIDPARVHFVGKLARPNYLNLLRISALHLYLSVPFVLSWSCIEALACGCLVLGSDVAPVREVLEDGVNGFLVDARDSELLARRAADLLARRALLASVRQTARGGAIARFELGPDAWLKQTSFDRRTRAVKAVITVLVGISSSTCAFAQPHPGLQIELTSGPVSALQDPLPSCDTRDYPDAPARAIRLADGTVQLLRHRSR